MGLFERGPIPKKVQDKLNAGDYEGAADLAKRGQRKAARTAGRKSAERADKRALEEAVQKVLTQRQEQEDTERAAEANEWVDEEGDVKPRHDRPENE